MVKKSHYSHIQWERIIFFIFFDGLQNKPEINGLMKSWRAKNNLFFNPSRFCYSVATLLNVGGPILGTPKAFSAVLSGEMKDTSVLGDLGRNILGKVVGKLVVFPRFFRALGSIPSMFPRGRLYFCFF
jgi:hypothetical protein